MTVKIEYDWKGFNLDTLKDVTSKKIKIVTLAKENDIWKITQWVHLKQAN